MGADTINIEQTGGCVTVSFTESDLPPDTMQAAANECAERMRYDGARRFIFDLSGVTFIDSQCLNVLINFAQELEHLRGRIAIAGAAPNVANVFYVTHLDRLFAIYDDVQDAVAAL